MRNFLFLPLILLGACDVSFSFLPSQAEAEAIVWYQTYGETQAPPPVEWFSGPTVPWSYGDDGRTLLGWKVQVAHDENPIYYTSYAHELFHWHCYNVTGDVDAAHSHCDWRQVDQANHDVLDALDPSPEQLRAQQLAPAHLYLLDEVR